MLLSLSKTNHAPFAATATAFSTYLWAFDIHVLLAAILRLGAAPDLTTDQYGPTAVSTRQQTHPKSAVANPQGQSAEWGLRLSEWGLRDSQRQSVYVAEK